MSSIQTPEQIVLIDILHSLFEKKTFHVQTSNFVWILVGENGWTWELEGLKIGKFRNCFPKYQKIRCRGVFGVTRNDFHITQPPRWFRRDLKEVIIRVRGSEKGEFWTSVHYQKIWYPEAYTCTGNEFDIALTNRWTLVGRKGWKRVKSEITSFVHHWNFYSANPKNSCIRYFSSQ